MIKYVIVGIVMVVEIYGTTILGAVYTIRNEEWVLISLICSIIFACISACIFIRILKEKEIKKDDSDKCPYFIEKYDDITNPEYIDRNM